MIDIAYIATTVSTIATCCIAIATLKYASATSSLAKATHDLVQKQADLGDLNKNISDATIRAQIISSTRLAWMDAVRDNVAELLSIDRQIKQTHSAPGLLGAEFIDNLIQRRQMIRYRIGFRLDPEKPNHVDLLAEIDALIKDNWGGETQEKLIDRLVISIMEFEWQRVRREVGGHVSVNNMSKTKS